MGASTPIFQIDFFPENFLYRKPIAIIIFKSTSGFHLQIATLIAIENYSGKISDRFMFASIRIPIAGTALQCPAFPIGFAIIQKKIPGFTSSSTARLRNRGG
jgi:hypothetical protein